MIWSRHAFLETLTCFSRNDDALFHKPCPLQLGLTLTLIPEGSAHGSSIKSQESKLSSTKYEIDNINSVNCSDLKLFTKSRNYPYVALTSFQGSGNTWTRHLLQVFTGISTGSLYHDQTIRKNSDLNRLAHQVNNVMCQNQPNYSNYIAIKCHRWPDYLRQGEKNVKCADIFNKAIFLIRNPVDAIISEYKRLKAKNSGAENAHVSKISNRELIRLWNEKLHSFQSQKVDQWLHLLTGWISFYSKLNKKSDNPKEIKSNLLILCYENLKEDTITQLQRLPEFLNLEKSEIRPQCLANNLEGAFHRPKARRTVKRSIDPPARDLNNIEMFTNETLLKMRNNMKTAYKLLDEYHYDQKKCILQYLHQIDLFWRIN